MRYAIILLAWFFVAATYKGGPEEIGPFETADQCAIVAKIVYNQIGAYVTECYQR